jgi:hypothetical protein
LAGAFFAGAFFAGAFFAGAFFAAAVFAGAAFLAAALAVLVAEPAAPDAALAGRRPITLRAALAVRPARDRELVRAIERAFLVAWTPWQ